MMAEDRYQYERIEAYILNTLSAKEKQRFERDLKNDQTLAGQYNIHLAEHQAMEHIVASELRGKFADWKQNPPAGFEAPVQLTDHLTSGNQPSRLPYLIAFFVIILIFIGLYVFTSRKGTAILNEEEEYQQGFSDSVLSNDPQKRYTDSIHLPPNQEKEVPENPSDQPNFKSEQKTDSAARYDMAYVEIANDYYTAPEELLSELRSGDQHQKSNFDQAIIFFNAGKFNEALQQLNSKSSANSNEQYLKGHILFKLRRFNEAAVQFSALTLDPVLPLFEDARWNLFLAYTASLPGSQRKWNMLIDQLQSDPDFDYKLEMKNLIDTVSKKK